MIINYVFESETASLPVYSRTGMGHEAAGATRLWGESRPCRFLRGEKMTNPVTDLDAYTDEELEEELARVLAHARGEVLNDAEVQKFWQLHHEILRRRAPPGTAA